MKYNAMSVRRYKNKGQDELFNKALMQYTLRRIERKPTKVDFGGLRDNPHYLVPESNYESVYEFWIEEDDGRTDAELQEYCDEMEVHNYTPYDCSGLMCTCYISWYRNKSGLISFVHKKNLDV